MIYCFSSSCRCVCILRIFSGKPCFYAFLFLSLVLYQVALSNQIRRKSFIDSRVDAYSLVPRDSNLNPTRKSEVIIERAFWGQSTKQDKVRERKNEEGSRRTARAVVVVKVTATLSRAISPRTLNNPLLSLPAPFFMMNKITKKKAIYNHEVSIII